MLFPSNVVEALYTTHKIGDRCSFEERKNELLELIAYSLEAEWRSLQLDKDIAAEKDRAKRKDDDIRATVCDNIITRYWNNLGFMANEYDAAIFFCLGAYAGIDETGAIIADLPSSIVAIGSEDEEMVVAVLERLESKGAIVSWRLPTIDGSGYYHVKIADAPKAEGK